MASSNTCCTKLRIKKGVNMRKVIGYLIIFFFFLPKMVIAVDGFNIYPYKEFSDNLNTKDKKSYVEFCDNVAGYYIELDEVVKKVMTGNTTDGKNMWEQKCKKAGNEIDKNKNFFLDKLSEGSQAYTDADDWFTNLQKLNSLLSNKGYSFVNSFILLTDELKKREDDIKDNEGVKNQFIEDIKYINNLAKLFNSFEIANDQQKWVCETEPLLTDIIKDMKASGSNIAVSIDHFSQDNSRQKVKVDPIHFKKGLKDLYKTWEFPPTFFAYDNLNFSFLGPWERKYVKKLADYQKVFDKWEDSLKFSERGNATLLHGQKYLKGWEWDDLTRMGIMNKYRSTLKKYKKLRLNCP